MELVLWPFDHCYYIGHAARGGASQLWPLGEIRRFAWCIVCDGTTFIISSKRCGSEECSYTDLEAFSRMAVVSYPNRDLTCVVDRLRMHGVTVLNTRQQQQRVLLWL